MLPQPKKRKPFLYSMNELTEWVSSLWKPEQNEYDLISPEIVSNPINMRSGPERATMYFGLDEGTPYLKILKNVNGVTQEDKYRIKSSHPRHRYLRYRCVPYGRNYEMDISFNRVFDYIETFIIYNKKILYYYAIDIDKKKRTFDLFQTDERMDELRDVYEIKKLLDYLGDI